MKLDLYVPILLELAGPGKLPASILGRDRGRGRWRCRLRSQRIEHGLRDVFAATRIVISRLDGINRSPGNAPPSSHQREQRERQSFSHRAFALSQEINVRGPAEREHDDRNAILKENELSSALNLQVQLSVFHSLDTANLGRHKDRVPPSKVEWTALSLLP